MSIKQLYLFLLISISLIFPATSIAFPFLTKSRILKNIGAQILVGENQNDAVVFDEDILRKYQVPTDGSNTFLISSDGLQSLKGKTVQKNILKACGPPYPGIGFKKEGYKGFLIVTGENLGNMIKWFPAKQININNSNCFTGLPNTHEIRFTTFYSDLLNGSINQARWTRKLTEKEIEEECRAMAEWNVKINKEKKFEKLYNGCIEGGWVCSEEERLVIVFRDKNGKCDVIINSSIDCDGQAKTGKNLYEFLGVLKLQHESEEEIWLIWNAPGYEGDGIYTIEIEDLKNKEKSSEEWLVYNGC